MGSCAAMRRGANAAWSHRAAGVAFAALAAWPAGLFREANLQMGGHPACARYSSVLHKHWQAPSLSSSAIPCGRLNRFRAFLQLPLFCFDSPSRTDQEWRRRQRHDSSTPSFWRRATLGCRSQGDPLRAHLLEGLVLAGVGVAQRRKELRAERRNLRGTRSESGSKFSPAGLPCAALACGNSRRWLPE